MKKFALKTLVCCSILILQLNQTSGKPGGDYGSLGDYGGGDFAGGSYQTLPDPSALLTNTDLKPASTYDIGYGGPIAEQIVPAVFPLRSFGWGGWKQPIPEQYIAPIQVIVKPVPFPVAIPGGWGWRSPGLF